MLGKVTPLIYGEQVQCIKQNAIHIEMVELTFADGTELEMSCTAYSKSFRGLINIHGQIEHIHYKPGNEAELKGKAHNPSRQKAIHP